MTLAAYLISRPMVARHEASPLKEPRQLRILEISTILFLASLVCIAIWMYTDWSWMTVTLAIFVVCGAFIVIAGIIAIFLGYLSRQE